MDFQFLKFLIPTFVVNWVCRPAHVFLLPKERDEKVAHLHFPALREELTVLSQEQADFIGDNVDCPFTGGHYRY